METKVQSILDSYKPDVSIAEAETISGPWYTDLRIAELERRHVFGATWQMVGRTAQVEKPGDFITAEVGGEPLIISRGQDNQLRADRKSVV